MKLWITFLGCLAFVGASVGNVALLYFRPWEPTHDGKTMTYWLVKIRSKSMLDRETAEKALTAIGEPAVPGLVDALFEPDHNVQTSALRVLTKMGPPMHPAIEDCLHSESSHVRQMAIRLLGKVGKEAIPALKRAMIEGRADVRKNALSALVEAGKDDPEIIRLVMEQLDNDDEMIRVSAIMALGRAGPKAAAAVDRICELAKSKSSLVRATAVSALGMIHAKPEVSVKTLIAALEDPIPDVRGYAVLALGQFGKDAAPAIPKLLKLWGSEKSVFNHHVAATLADIGHAAVEDLIRVAKSDEPETKRAFAVFALGQVRPTTEAVARVLIELSRFPESEVAREAVDALSNFSDQSDLVVPALIAALRDADPGVRFRAARSLGYLQAKEALPELRALVERKRKARPQQQQPAQLESPLAAAEEAIRRIQGEP